MNIRKKFWEWKYWQPPHFIGFKVVAVILALVLWGYVTITQNPLTEAIFSVPVEIRNLADNVAQPEMNYQVQVRVQGTSTVINSLTSHDFAAYVDLSGMEPGEVAPIINVDLPENVTQVSRSPESINLTLEPVVSAQFDVDLIAGGKPAENYTVMDAVLSPELVTLSGSQSNIDSIASVRVTADVAGLQANYSRNLPVTVVDGEGNDITNYFTISPAVVGVLIPIIFNQPEASLAVRAATTGQPAEGYQVSRIVVQPATLSAFGSLSTLNSLYYLETEPIDISGLSATTSFTARLVHNDDLTLSAETVTVVVQIEPISSVVFARELQTTRNLADWLTCVVPDTRVEITVSGPGDAVAAISSDGLIPYLDCSAITGPGEYTLPVSVDLPSNITLVETSPGSVSITVESATAQENGGSADEGNSP